MKRMGIRVGMLALVIAALLVTFIGFGGAETPGAGGSSSEQEPAQLSLAQAASEPSGVAAGDVPAADVGASGASSPAVDPEAVLGSPTEGVGSNGCLTDYGDAGQCLAAVPPSHEGHDVDSADAPTWTCSLVRSSFPSGIVVKVAGVDPLGLDANANGTACDPTDGG